MAAITRHWKDWISRYSADGAYWYVPKGKSIADVATIHQQLGVLKRFEGERWRESQREYLSELKRAGLSEAKTHDPDEQGIPMSRMLAQVFGTLGFAWIDENEAVTITPAGEVFLAARDPAANVANQARRYQIANPMAGGRETRQIEIHPVPYLLEVLLQTRTLTRTEYVLFCAKAKSFGDIEDSIEDIQEWRKLGPRQQRNIINGLEAVQIAKPGSRSRRSSIYNTVRLNSSYALAFWAASRVITQSQDAGEFILRIPRNRLPEANAIVKQSQTDGQFIVFAIKKDWIAYYGDPSKPPSKATALSYYADTERLDMVKQVLDDIGGYTEDQKRRYLSMIVNEQIVEDIWARNMELIEPGMTLLDRQLQTEVGRIDLFARDKDNIFTVIELKKGKTDDEVFGQLSRYLGWCKKTKARSGNVRGIIIAKEIGKKLWATADDHDTPVELIEYDLKMSLTQAQRDVRAQASQARPS